MYIPEIIYSDQDIIVINKPPGTAVHGGGFITGQTLVDFLVCRFPEIQNVGDDPVIRPGIVHRLDKDTSGVMVAARRQESFEALKLLFQSRQVEKIYRAIACGEVKRSSGVIASPIGRLAKNPTKRGVAVGRSKIRGAREAVTEYRVLKSGGGYSLVELKPKTGRMHQIRVHVKSIGNPIACDRVYGGKNVCCPPGANRQLLHARSLSFTYPEGRHLHFEAEEPEDFRLAQRRIVE